jgi:hypothetical protein
MKKLIIGISLVLILTIVGCTEIIVPPEDFTDENIQLATVMPDEENFLWTYSGFAEYGHTMTLDTISGDSEYKAYTITGEFLDMSDGESQMDPSISMQYIIENGKLIQFVTGEMIMDPSYQGIILLQTPLELETSWEQTVADNDGNEITLVSEIVEINIIDGKETYTVMYEDAGSNYYEIRKFRQGSGLIAFEKLYQSAEGDFDIAYTLYEEGSGQLNTIMNQAIAEIMPSSSGYEWIYSGFVEYGHQMTLTEVIQDNNLITYSVVGEVYDPSDGEATGDYSIDIEYYISNGELRQSINAERLMEPEYQDMILIKYPLNIGTSWQQTVSDLSGNQYTYDSEIYDLTVEDNQWVYHVKYQDTQSDYYELREFQAGKGMISFSKLYEFDEGSEEIGYWLFE